jgi:hypothetical protein
VCFSVEGWIYVSCCIEAAASPVTGLSSLEIVWFGIVHVNPGHPVWKDDLGFVRDF